MSRLAAIKVAIRNREVQLARTKLEFSIYEEQRLTYRQPCDLSYDKFKMSMLTNLMKQRPVGLIAGVTQRAAFASGVPEPEYLTTFE